MGIEAFDFLMHKFNQMKSVKIQNVFFPYI